MKIITFRILGTDTIHTATIEGKTKAEADGNAIRIFAEADMSIEYTIERTARAGESRNTPNIHDALAEALRNA